MTSVRAYLVCATPRSGSTLLCEMLRETGVAGRPLEHFEILRHSSLPRQPHEYFEDLPLPQVLSLLAPPHSGAPDREPALAWWARIRARGQTSNGVWGGKLMWMHTHDLVARARDLAGLETVDLDGVLRVLLADPLLIFMTRGDKVAQAVSLWRALQTRSWRADDASPSQSGVYSFAAIDHLVAQLTSDERSWRDWFARTARRPLEVSYEQLDAAPTETISPLLDALGVSEKAVTFPSLSRQRDELSAAWIERYRQDAEEAA